MGVTLAKGLSPAAPAKGKKPFKLTKDRWVSVRRIGSEENMYDFDNYDRNHKLVLLKDGSSVRSGKMLFRS